MGHSYPLRQATMLCQAIRLHLATRLRQAIRRH